MVTAERNAATGVVLLWDGQRGTWVLDTPDGRLYLGELSAAEAVEEYATAVSAARVRLQ